MGKTKVKIFTPAQNRIANLAKALGHPARIAILQHLINTESCVCGEIVEEIPLSQSTISQHLKELKNAGIIHGNIEGVKVCYCINPEVWGELKTVLNNFFARYKNCC